MSSTETVHVRCGDEQFSAEPLSLDRSYLDCRPTDIAAAPPGGG